MDLVRGKRLALGLAAGTVAVLGLGGIASRDLLRERWYLWKLEKGDASEWEEAALVLAELRSARAIPRLIELFRREPEYRYAAPNDPLSNQAFGNPWSNAILRVGKDGLGALLASAGQQVQVRAGPVTPEMETRHIAFWALFKLGTEAEMAVPALIVLLRSPDYAVREYAAQVLGAVGPAAASAVPALRELVPDRGTGGKARWALERITGREADS